MYFFNPFSIWVKILDFITSLNSLQSPVKEFPQTDDVLLQKFIQFLHEDKVLSNAINENRIDLQSSIKHKRATDQVEIIEEKQNQQEADSTFLERAASFMVELLQRFLKWINSD